MDVSKIKLVAFDLDGTLTQNKTPMTETHRAVLDKLGEKYRLLMVSAGMCHRVFDQMGQYPIDIYSNCSWPCTAPNGSILRSLKML